MVGGAERTDAERKRDIRQEGGRALRNVLERNVCVLQPIKHTLA